MAASGVAKVSYWALNYRHFLIMESSNSPLPIRFEWRCTACTRRLVKPEVQVLEDEELIKAPWQVGPCFICDLSFLDCIFKSLWFYSLGNDILKEIYITRDGYDTYSPNSASYKEMYIYSFSPTTEPILSEITPLPQFTCPCSLLSVFDHLRF